MPVPAAPPGPVPANSRAEVEDFRSAGGLQLPAGRVAAPPPLQLHPRRVSIGLQGVGIRWEVAKVLRPGFVPSSASVEEVARTCICGCGAPPSPSPGSGGDIAPRPSRGRVATPRGLLSRAPPIRLSWPVLNSAPSCQEMGAAVFFGCTFVAFGPAFALFLITVAGDPLRVIILVAG